MSVQAAKRASLELSKLKKLDLSGSGPAQARPTIIMSTYGLLAPAGGAGRHRGAGAQTGDFLVEVTGASGRGFGILGLTARIHISLAVEGE